MSTFFTSRNLDPEILEEVSKLDEMYFPLPWSKKQWQEINWEEYLLLGLQIEGKVACFSLSRVISLEGTIHLLKIFTPNELRGRGYAQKLLRKLSEIGAAQSMEKVYLEVESSNADAVRFYSKFGFEIVHHAKNYYGSGRHGEMMTLQISS